MNEIKFYGRGGQGVVTAANLLARAAIFDGKYAHSFPFFGAERRGAPVFAFTRTSDAPIRTREQIYNPDYVVVLDPTIHIHIDVTAGLKEKGHILVNSRRAPDEAAKTLHTQAEVLCVDATGIAMEILKKTTHNTAMLGALVGAFGLASLESLRKALRQHFGKELGDLNTKVAEVAYSRVRGE